MQLMKQESNINFLGMSKFWMLVSATLIVVSFVSFFTKGFNYGIDFLGGTAINVKFEKKDISADKIREALKIIGMQGATVQNYGEKGDNEYLIKLGISDTLSDNEEVFKEAIAKVLKPGNKIKNVRFAVDKMYVTFDKSTEIKPVQKALESLKLTNISLKSADQYGKASNNEYLFEFFGIQQMISSSFDKVFGKDSFEILKVDNVGRKVGKELRTNAILAAFIALFFILIYIWLRFEIEFAPGAVICLIHDAIITAGVFSLMGLEIDTTFIAAILTIVGYSINDTIVIYDRIRENLITLKSESFKDIINRSINQTLSRTILTSLTFLFVTVVILIYGGAILFNMALALTIGVFIGTYSTIYIASPLTLYLSDRFFTKKRS